MSNSSKLLINESPLQVLPSLACLVGLTEAIVLQQLHYWLYTAEKTRKLGKYKAGRWWIFDTLKEWQQTNFPFWSTKTIQRALDHLRELRIVLAARMGDSNLDQTLSYSIDYDRLNLLLEQEMIKEAQPPDGQNVQMGAPDGQNVQMHVDKESRCRWTKCPTVNDSETSDSEITHRLPEEVAPPSLIILPDAIKVIDPSAAEILQAVKSQLKQEMQRGAYLQYVEPLNLVGWVDGIFRVSIPGNKTRDFVRVNLGRQIDRLLTAYAGREVHIEVQVRETV